MFCGVPKRQHLQSKSQYRLSINLIEMSYDRQYCLAGTHRLEAIPDYRISLPTLSNIFEASYVGHLPSIEPSHVGILMIAAGHAKYDRAEEDEESNSTSVENRMDSPSDGTACKACHPVDAESEYQDSEV